MLDLWERVGALFFTAFENSFLYLALNNLGVLLLLWMVSAVWLYYGVRTPASRRRVCRLALYCYLFFFLKELFRINRTIADFSSSSKIPYGDILVNLILPHGLIEYLAFALAAAFACLARQFAGERALALSGAPRRLNPGLAHSSGGGCRVHAYSLSLPDLSCEQLKGRKLCSFKNSCPDTWQ